MAFTLPKLPYDFGALEPNIDAKTMEIHHDKHHAAYVNNLNKALEAVGGTFADMDPTTLCKHIKNIPEAQRLAVRNNRGAPLRLRLGVALRRERQETLRLFDAESGQPVDGGDCRMCRNTGAGTRRLGARLLPQVSEQTPRLHPGLVECGRLGRRRQAVERGVTSIFL